MSVDRYEGGEEGERGGEALRQAHVPLQEVVDFEPSAPVDDGGVADVIALDAMQAVKQPESAPYIASRQVPLQAHVVLKEHTFSSKKGSMDVAELAEASGLPEAEVKRIIRTLIRENRIAKPGKRNTRRHPNGHVVSVYGGSALDIIQEALIQASERPTDSST